LLRWLGERREEAASVVAAAAAISTPIDVHAGGRALSQGFGLVYTRSFLKTLKRKAAQKLVQFPACSTATRCWRAARCTSSTTR